jgi:hypothetical protein
MLFYQSLNMTQLSHTIISYIYICIYIYIYIYTYIYTYSYLLAN